MAYPEDTEENENFFGNHGGCDESVHEVQLAAGQFLRGALVSDTGSDGLYPNHTCQNWNIITEENRVYYLPKKITIESCVSTLHVLVTKPKIMHFII